MTLPERSTGGGRRLLGDEMRRAGDLEAARRAYERALAMCIEVGDDVGAAACREGLGRTALEAEDYEAGLEHLVLAYGHYSSHAMEIPAARCSYRILLPLVLQGRYTEARTLLDANLDTLLRNEGELFRAVDVLSVDGFLSRRAGGE